MNTVLAIEISDFSRLTATSSSPNDNADGVMRVDDAHTVCFAVSVVPVGQQLEAASSFFRMDFERFSALFHAVSAPVHTGSSGVHVFAPQASLENQAISKEEAELAYVQGGSKELIISGPNGEGYYTLYPAVVMRTTPHLRMGFSKDDVTVEPAHDRSKPHKVLFRLFDRHGIIRLQDLRPLISDIELDAEIY